MRNYKKDLIHIVLAVIVIGGFFLVVTIGAISPQLSNDCSEHGDKPMADVPAKCQSYFIGGYND